MEDVKNLKDEQVKNASGGDNGEDENNPWVDIKPVSPNRPQIPDPNQKPPVNPLPQPKNGPVCPKCGNYMMFQVVDVTGEGKRLRCTVCKTEFMR